MVLTQGVQLLGVEVAPAGQCRIEHRAGVAFGEDEAVPSAQRGFWGSIFSTWKYRAVTISTAEREPPGMSSLGGVDHGDDVLSDLDGLLFQPSTSRWVK